MVVDWVEEGEVELGYSLGDYMALEGQAVGEALAGLVGWCEGGVRRR